MMNEIRFKVLTVYNLENDIELESYLRQGWIITSTSWDGSNWKIFIRK